MTTPSGQISLNDVNVELGLSGTTLISMNQSNVRTLAGVGGSGTQISMQNLQNKSNRVTANITIASDTANYTLNTAKVTGYDAGKTDVTLTINSGVFVYSNSTGSYALTVDTSWSTGDTVTIVNNGYILGDGGNGGRGGDWGGFGTTGGGGGGGGPALLVQRATSINNLYIIGGGGGGGGGGGAGDIGQGKTSNTTGGGGGGGGVGGGSGGGGGVSANNPGGSGGSGNFSSPGSGGSSVQGVGGSGGVAGSSGNSGSSAYAPGGGGGSGGGAVVGNSNITWIATGTRYGSIS